MLTVRDQHTIHADLTSVFACVWNAELWPRITPHVQRIEMLEAGERSQRFLMTVLANGTAHTVESVREAIPDQRVVYHQTRPPVFLTTHEGEWNFQPVADGVRIELIHRAAVDYDKALTALQVDSPAAADEVIRQTLKANGARTLLAIKEYLEASGPWVSASVQTRS